MLWEPNSETGEPKPCRAGEWEYLTMPASRVNMGVDVRSGQTGFKLVT